MKRLAMLTAALATVLSFAVSPSPAFAASTISVPITGSGSGATFKGTFRLQKFVANTTGGVDAVGTIEGIVTDALGVVTNIVANVKLPVFVKRSTCDILELELGPISIDLLGLQIDLSKVVLTITAQSGAGNLLGNLLCQVAGLLDNPNSLAKLLNDIIALL
jgi:hypothetical protein